MSVAIESERLIAEAVECARASDPPRATYRLQFNADFTFDMARQIVPYLAELGISHLYVSPIFAAAPGSMHGYDVVDYGQINPEIGSREDFDRLVETLHDHEMGLILDFVPNHMGIENGANAWWQDVLENGQASPFASYFDIDWSPLKRELRGKVLLPTLGDQYGSVLEQGELTLGYDDGAFTLHYWETPFPIAPSTYPMLLEHALDLVRERVAEDDLDLLELESIGTALENLPAIDRDDLTSEEIDARQREQLVSKNRLATLIARSNGVRDAVDDTIEFFNGTRENSASFNPLDQLLSLQAYRLANWRVAAEEINYRRFFAINTLAGIRQNEREVFDASHGLLMELLAAGQVDGVRIDHPDGLWDPAGYFRDLQQAYLVAYVQREVRRSANDEEAFDALWAEQSPKVEAQAAVEIERIGEAGDSWPLYVVVEKILEHGEALPQDWAVAGTVGYEFAHAATAVLVDADARALFDKIYARYTGDRVRFNELVYDMKQRQMREAFASEVNVLSGALNRISEQDRHSRDFTLNSLRNAIREVMASYSVYRTYTRSLEDGVASYDQRQIEHAIAHARRRNRSIDPSVFDFLQSVLLLDQSDRPRARRERDISFAMQMQQLTGPVMAKGLEDTAFYRFNRLVALNEVGGDPSRFGMGVDEFHRQNRARLRHWPHAMLTASTHDTKRSEDVRARIAVLSELPTDWRAACNRWSRLNRRLRERVDIGLAPHRIDEYVVYQTLVGTWPLVSLEEVNLSAYSQRIQEYMVKVAREANRFMNWLNADEAYESALTGFIAGLFDRRRSAAFLDDMSNFVAQVLSAGLANGLTQQVLRLASPGVPDIYQGTEYWDDSLVDPDNRRPVDFAARQETLGSNIPRTSYGASLDLRAPQIKQHITQQALGVRRRYPKVFTEGDYIGLEVEGVSAEHVIAFARVHDGTAVIMVGTRLTYARTRGNDEGDWGDTCVVLPDVLAGHTWSSAFLRQTTVHENRDEASFALNVAQVLGSLPVALLVSHSGHAKKGAEA